VQHVTVAWHRCRQVVLNHRRHCRYLLGAGGPRQHSGLTFKCRTFETVVAQAGRSLFNCTLLLSVPFRALPLVAFRYPTAQIRVLWPLQPYLSVHKYVYFGHFSLTFQCTNMCTLATSALPFSAPICVLWPLQPYLSVHKYVYFGHFGLTFQCTNMCTLVTSALPFSAPICVLWPLQPYLSVHQYVYFGHFSLTFQCTNMCTLATSALPFSAQICVLWSLQPYLPVHKYVYLATSALRFSAQICVLRPINVNVTPFETRYKRDDGAD
jgi:hypothetical protein